MAAGVIGKDVEERYFDLKVTLFWDVAPYSLVKPTDVSDDLTGLIIALMVEEVSSSETSGNIYRTTRRNIVKNNHLHNRRCENLMPHLLLDRPVIMVCTWMD
jgi:hypothetical protein